MPIRHESFGNVMSLEDAGEVREDLVKRHQNYLREIDKKQLLKVLLVISRVADGKSIQESIKESDKLLNDDPSSSSKLTEKKKSVSFREGSHDVRTISEDDDFEIELPEESNENKIETNFSWDDDDGEFAF